MGPRIAAALVLVTAVAIAPRAMTEVPRVDHLEVPGGGIQPQAAIDGRGTIHLIYYLGPPSGGDLFYVRRGARDAAFSPPLRVNSEPGSAIAAGAVRGGRLALGRDGWVHVAWNAAHAVERDGAMITPMWYARLPPGAHAFEPQRAIGTHTKNLDGGGTVAADAGGRVFVVWHAAGDQEGEAHRRMLVAESTDDGAHFAADRVLATPGGACGCCGAAALVDGAGRLQIVYRSALDGVHRDPSWMTLGGGAVSSPVHLQSWDLPVCPMTTFALARAGDALVAAWMVEQQIFTANLDAAARVATAPSAMSGSAVRNHPALAIDAAGNRLFAWIEGANRSREGTAAWELRDARGQRLASRADAGTTPPLSLIGAIARPDGSFILIY